MRGDCEKKVLGGDILVFKAVRLLERAFQHFVQGLPHVLLGKTLHLRQAGNFALNFLRQRLAAHSQARQQGRHHAVSLSHQCGKQMDRLDLLVLVARRDFLCALHGLLSLDGHFFKSQHRNLVLNWHLEKGLAPSPAP